MDENSYSRSKKTVLVELTSDEALVLFEFLSRLMDSEGVSICDPAERVALWNLQSMLESILVEPLEPNTIDLLDDARCRLRA